MRLLNAEIKVVESQTLIASCEGKREISFLFRNTPNIGKRTSSHILCQKPILKLVPCVFKTPNSESSAL